MPQKLKEKPQGKKFGEVDKLDVGGSHSFSIRDYTSLMMCLQYRKRRYDQAFTSHIEGNQVRVTRIQ